MEAIGIVAIGVLLFGWWTHRFSLEMKKAIQETSFLLHSVKNKADANDNAIGRLKSRVMTTEDFALKAYDQVKSLINLDIGQHRDCGWLVLITKVKGQDRVMLQELKPGMTIHEYDDLVMRLKHDCAAHLAFIDAPMGYGEAFLQRHRIRESRR